MSEISRPPFVPFDRDKATRAYRRNLPHWRQSGATYFVTFRLNDAMPAEAKARLDEQLAKWLSAKGVDPRSDLRDGYEQLGQRDRFLFRKYFNRLREEIHDSGYGNCFLARPQVVETFVEQLFVADGCEMHIGDYIVMPNHVHLLIDPAKQELEDCLKRIKGRSATFCNRLLERTGTFWQSDSFDHIVRNLDQLEKYRVYIRDNPANAGIAVPPLAYYRAAWL